MALFVLPWVYVPDPTQSRALFNAKLYFGVADQDPILFPKDVTLIQEDGSSIVAEQPIRTNSGGTPTYDNSPVAIDLTGDYSLRVLDRNDNQIYEYPSLVATDDNLTANALRAAALRLNLDANEIGTTLITNAEGQSLDSAEYLLDTDTGLLYSLPDDIPAGSTVVSSSGTTLVTSNGQFEMTNVWFPVENRFKGNQNWNVEGSTGAPLPTAVDYTYSPSDEVVSGRFCLVELVNATYDDGLFNADSGSYYVEYDGDFTSDYYGVKLADSSITQDGCSISLEGGTTTRITVDVGIVGPHKFPGFSESVGNWPDINDDDSFIAQTGSLGITPIDVTASRASGVTYTNTRSRSIDVYINCSGNTAGGNVVYIPVIGGIVLGTHRSSENSGVALAGDVFYMSVPAGQTYLINVATGSITKWVEV